MHIGFSLVILHSSEKFDSSLDKLIIFLEESANTFALSFRSCAGIWYIPAALLVLRLSKMFLITSSDKFDNSKSLDTLHEVLA